MNTGIMHGSRSFFAGDRDRDKKDFAAWATAVQPCPTCQRPVKVYRTVVSYHLSPVGVYCDHSNHPIAWRPEIDDLGNLLNEGKDMIYDED